mmetsp:Transcript_39015/g.76741  ORF Transcript_39015/g.76741 Transcript_39015/m.76741 type:complete len:102 (-) Transcript_39015:35-340(-)
MLVGQLFVFLFIRSLAVGFHSMLKICPHSSPKHLSLSPSCVCPPAFPSRGSNVEESALRLSFFFPLTLLSFGLSSLLRYIHALIHGWIKLKNDFFSFQCLR